MNLDQKINIYLSGYSTSRDYSITDYLNILDEYRTRNKLYSAIKKLSSI